jgi:hypothetical protein
MPHEISCRSAFQKIRDLLDVIAMPPRDEVRVLGKNRAGINDEAGLSDLLGECSGDAQRLLAGEFHWRILKQISHRFAQIAVVMPLRNGSGGFDFCCFSKAQQFPIAYEI